MPMGGRGRCGSGYRGRESPKPGQIALKILRGDSPEAKEPVPEGPKEPAGLPPEGVELRAKIGSEREDGNELEMRDGQCGDGGESMAEVQRWGPSGEDGVGAPEW
jgi:hypothetical protein